MANTPLSMLTHVACIYTEDKSSVAPMRQCAPHSVALSTERAHIWDKGITSLDFEGQAPWMHRDTPIAGYSACFDGREDGPNQDGIGFAVGQECDWRDSVSIEISERMAKTRVQLAGRYT